VATVTESVERRDQMVRVRVAHGDLESWRRAAGPEGNVSTWLRSAASKAVSDAAMVAGADLERGVPVEVVELRASVSEASSWRQAAGDHGLASWLRAVASAELSKVGAPVPADVRLPDAGAADRSVAQEARGAPPASGEATPQPPAAGIAAPVAAVTAPAVPGEDAEDRRRRSMTIEQVLSCPHPEEDHKRTGYMVMCVRCGRRQEGRDRWAGAGYAAWTPGWQAACPHPATERISRPWGAACGVCGTLVG
jgi:hypothetical protein